MIKNIISIAIKTFSLLIILAVFLLICLNMSPFDIYVNCGFLLILGVAIVFLLYDIISDFALCYEYKRQKKQKGEN